MKGPTDIARRIVERVLLVPHEPHPPSGSPGSLRVFRAGTNQFRLQRALWAARQAAVFAGLAFGFWLGHRVLAGDPLLHRAFPPARWIASHPGEVARWHLAGWFLAFKAAGLVTALVVAVVSWTLMRLRYELHWYMVTDRSLRIREGVTRVREMTLSFANIQQIVVRQGPLQRLLGLADVVVTTAGGGGMPTGEPRASGHRDPAEPCHVGVLASVDNADAIRDLMLERLRHLRSSGLGDPDDTVDPHAAHHVHTAVQTAGGEALSAAREVLAEVRELRARIGT